MQTKRELEEMAKSKKPLTTSIEFLEAYLGSIIFQYISGFMSEYFSKNRVFYIDILLLFVISLLTIVINNKNEDKMTVDNMDIIAVLLI